MGEGTIQRIANQNLNVYRVAESRLQEDVNQEAQLASDCRGRLVYELLQNADDAMEGNESETQGNPTVSDEPGPVQTKVTSEAMAALEAQTVTLAGEHTWDEVTTDLAGDLERVTSHRDELRDEIEEVFRQHPLGHVLVTLCGFGPRTGARTLAEIGDPNRFTTASQLASYAGLAPVDRKSGSSINSSSQSRGGNHRLKNAMFIAAFVATRHDPDARNYYQRKRDEGKKHNAAVICVARRRCDIVLAMLKTGAVCNPNHKTELQKAA